MKNIKRHCDIFALAGSGFTGKAKVTSKRNVTIYNFSKGFVTSVRKPRSCHHGD